MKRLVFLLSLLAGWGNAVSVDTLPLLYNPLTPTPKQQFTPQERESLRGLIRSLSSRRSPEVLKSLGGEWCPIDDKDALLSFTAPFRNARPEKLEVVLICSGERGGVSLTFTQDGKRTTYLLPPQREGGGVWSIVGAYTVRDLNGDGRRELTLVISGAGGVGEGRSLQILTFDQAEPLHFGEFEVFADIYLPAQEGGGGKADVLRVQKGKTPVVYAVRYQRPGSSETWVKTGKTARTTLTARPLEFIVWP